MTHGSGKTGVNLKAAFEAFVRSQAEQSDDMNLAQMMATPYQDDGKLAAAFLLFKYGFELGEANTVEGIFGDGASKWLKEKRKQNV